MNRNIGFLDFVLRMVLAMVLMGFAAATQSVILGIFGLGGFIVALSGWDPIYTIIGLNNDNTK